MSDDYGFLNGVNADTFDRYRRDCDNMNYLACLTTRGMYALTCYLHDLNQIPSEEVPKFVQGIEESFSYA